MPAFPTKCDVEWVDAEDPLFLLYTSGSTGKPKVVLISEPLSHRLFLCPFSKATNILRTIQGVLHTTGGYMVYSATTFKHAFDYKPTDIYW